MKYLIVGLGNIGDEYDGTRHNIGFEVLDYFAIKHKGKFKGEKFGTVAEVKFKARTLYLLKPNTYMNLSGNAMRYWMEKLNVNTENTLVLTDDIALPVGKIRLKGKGSAGGHNGLKSIEQTIGTSKYARLRIGVGSGFSTGKQADYVLGKFENKEFETIQDEIIPACMSVVEDYVFVGLDRTMNSHNGK